MPAPTTDNADTGPVRSVTRDGVTTVRYRPVTEILAIILTAGIIAFLLVILAAVII